MEPSRSIEVTDRIVDWHILLPERDAEDISMIVLHATELPDMTAAWAEAEKSASASESGRGVCGHIYVDRDGTVYRFVPFDRVAFHVQGFNTPSIGIELVNRGRYPNWFKSWGQEPEEKFPSAQIDALRTLLRSLREQYPTILELRRHSDLDNRLIPAEDQPEQMVRRRIDPGPLFPWTDVVQDWEGTTGGE
ncbi:N-acetylmuramoyl-L-alanine amidase [Streptomyces phaeochromogenes]|uniref:N-acetylmuramoyl-L-alanine amidase n=1 Tax=Streptomyces phaeochromogenes TaxID=1923 RepID=UPI00368F69D7